MTSHKKFIKPPEIRELESIVQSLDLVPMETNYHEMSFQSEEDLFDHFPNESIIIGKSRDEDTVLLWFWAIGKDEGGRYIFQDRYVKLTTDLEIIIRLKYGKGVTTIV